jgi:hypothetical protein
MKNQKEHIEEAIKHLESAIDIYPDKTDEIRFYNDLLERIIARLKRMI